MNGKLSRVLVVLAVLLIGISSWTWWHYVHSQPDNVFWGMIDNSLKTRSVTHATTQQASGQQSIQISRLQTAPSNLALGINKIQQQASEGTTKVTTESIGNPYLDYVRYSDIRTTTKDSKGKIPDYSSVKGVWGKSAQTDPKQANGQLFNQAVLGIIPFANIPGSQRLQIVQAMRTDKAYSFNPQKVKKEIKDKRPVYTYDVTIKAFGYVKALKRIGSATGLTQLETVNPEDYKTTPDSTFQVIVDVWSHQLNVVIQPERGSRDNFTSHGLTSINPKLPAKTTSIDELQKRLQPAQ